MNWTKLAARALLVVVVLGLVVVGIRIVDPLASPERPPAIEPDESPEEVAYAAMKHDDTRDYTVHSAGGRTESTDPTVAVNTTPSARVKYELTDNQVRTFDPENEEWQRFENQYIKWFRVSDGDAYDVHREQSLGLSGRFHDEQVVRTCGCVRVADENRSTLVLRIDENAVTRELLFGNPLVNTAPIHANITLVIDKNDRQLNRVVIRVMTRTDRETDENQTIYTVVKTVSVYDDWGETEVQRPDWAAYSKDEFVLDLVNAERRE